MSLGGFNGTGRVIDGIENCLCPSGYSGLSCETCDYGYVKQIDPFTTNILCKKCNCHNHSPECNQITNHCSVRKNTQHNNLSIHNYCIRENIFQIRKKINILFL